MSTSMEITARSKELKLLATGAGIRKRASEPTSVPQGVAPLSSVKTAHVARIITTK
jgi:hypothetical protein